MKKKSLLIITCTALQLILRCGDLFSQQRWDGEGGDSAWSNPNNWHPNGVPASGQDVLLDNSLLNRSYKVVLPSGNISLQLNSLQIAPAAGNRIGVELPFDNTAAPALTLGSTTNAMVISEGGEFINGSGASAGNPLLLNGPLSIKNGGKYIHRTIRGNAGITSRLARTGDTENGTVEFDVPGNNNYTLSVSGRSFGNLSLKAEQAGKKTYSGSGSNDLHIRGDLLISGHCSFNTTLTGNLRIGKSITGAGNLSLQPASQDTTGRELVFSADSSSFGLQGTFTQGPYFRNIRIGTGSLRLKASIRPTHDSVGFLLASGTALLTDTFSILGKGLLKAEDLATVFLGSASGITDENGTGNIRIPVAIAENETRFVFNGTLDQQTGNRFPGTVGSLTIDKPRGDLSLTRHLKVINKITLNHGKLISTDTATITLTGNFTVHTGSDWGWMGGHEKSYIVGKLALACDSLDTLCFPVGRDSVYAPIAIGLGSPMRQLIEVAYFPTPHPVSDTVSDQVRQQISKKEHWIIDEKYPTPVIMQQGRNYTFSMRAHSQDSSMEQPHLMHFNQKEGKWEPLPPRSNNPYPNTLSATSTVQRSGIFALGSFYPSALGKTGIVLEGFPDKNKILLKWTSHLDREVRTFHIEQSPDGKNFAGIGTIGKISGSGSSCLIARPVQGVLLRIKAIDIDGKNHCSNTVRIPLDQSMLQVIPNPGTQKITVRSGRDKVLRIMGILDGGGKMWIQAVHTYTKEWEADISSLPKGLYWILLTEGTILRRIPFIKG